jgi:hypothetical protein
MKIELKRPQSWWLRKLARNADARQRDMYLEPEEIEGVRERDFTSWKWHILIYCHGHCMVMIQGVAILKATTKQGA